MVSLATRAAAAIRPERIVDDLLGLVAVPSITGDEGPVQDEMAVRLAAAGLSVQRLEADPVALAADPDWPGAEVERTRLPVVAGVLRGSRPGPRLVLGGHVDVVPPGSLDTWSSPPFEPVLREGRIYGRGACDMKGGLVALLEAVRALRDGGGDRSGDVVVLAVPSEEDGGAGMLAAVRAGYGGDMAVIAEPTDLEVVVAHAGAITFRLDVPGRAAHASTPHEGVSALDKLGYLVEALRRDETARNAAESDPLMVRLGLPYPTIIGKVSGGDWASTVMDAVVAEGRYGVKLGQSCAQAADDLRRAIAEAWAADDFLSAHPTAVAVTGARFEPSRISPDHPLPVSLARAAERVTGRAAPLVGAPYGADMRFLVNQGRTPTVMFGPGDVRVAHAADEHVSLDDVATCARVLAYWMGEVLGRGDG